MKNNEEMYQSVLARRAEYREKKNRRIIIIKRTVPAIACFCFAAFIGIYFHAANLSRTPEQSGIIEETTLISTSACHKSDSSTTVQTTMKNAAVTLSSSAANTHTTTAKSTVTNISHTTETDADDDVYSGDVNETAETNAVTSKPVHTKTTVRTESRTTSRTTSATAAKTTLPTAVTKTTETKSPILTVAPLQPTVQPVYFETVSDIAETAAGYIPSTDDSTVVTCNIEPSAAEKTYSQMYSRIKNDGCIFAVKENDTISLRNDFGFYLFPYARYEDIGVGGYAEFNGSLYHVTFYYADSITADNTNGITEYLHERMGRRCDEELDINGQTVSILHSSDGRIYAGFFIDECHYIDVVSSVSDDEMKDFLNMLEYETIYF